MLIFLIIQSKKLWNKISFTKMKMYLVVNKLFLVASAYHNFTLKIYLVKHNMIIDCNNNLSHEIDNHVNQLYANEMMSWT